MHAAVWAKREAARGFLEFLSTCTLPYRTKCNLDISMQLIRIAGFHHSVAHDKILFRVRYFLWVVDIGASIHHLFRGNVGFVLCTALVSMS